MAEDLNLSEEMIEAWHDGAGSGLELHEYLGLSWEEYGAVVLDPDKLEAAVQQAMERLREIHLDYTDRNDEHRMYCQHCQSLWPCPEGIRGWHAVEPEEFPLR